MSRIALDSKLENAQQMYKSLVEQNNKLDVMRFLFPNRENKPSPVCYSAYMTCCLLNDRGKDA